MTRVAMPLLILMVALAAVVAGRPAVLSAANQNVGYVDFSFGSAPGTDPTADKPQSKLWHNDGLWWAIMFHTGSGTWHIYRLSWPDQWIDTGTVVDTRPTSRADVLWDGTKLYVAALVRFGSASQQGLFSRFSYSPATQAYTLDSGFPATMMTGSAETLAMDKDSTGQFWITYTQGSKVYVNRTTGSDTSWGTAFVVPGPTSATSLNADDISSLVAYTDQDGSSIGVLWSNHNTPSSMYFAHHRDSDADDVWQPIEQIYTATCAADDHINLKSLQSDSSGTLFAAVKTSFGDSGCGNTGSDPLLRLVVRKPNNTWQVTTFGAVSDQHTRPIVLLDTTNRKVYMFATAPTSCGVIYMKSTSMDNPSFPAGKGTPFISSSTYTCINNATSTKQTVSAATGLVVLASDESKKFYLHNAIALGAPPPDTTAPTVTGRAPVAGAADVLASTSVTATFSEAVNGVSAGSFTLTPSGGVAVAATVTYDSASRTATLQPGALLAPNTSYTAALAPAITDSAGNPLAATSWSFTTAPPDLTAPSVTAQSPAPGAADVAVGANPTVTFSEAVAGVSGATFTLSGPAGAVPASVSYNPASRTATLVPGAPLAVSSSYTLNLAAGITDLAGNPLAPLSWSFSTAAPPLVALQNGGFEIDANNDGRPDVWTSNAKFTRSNALGPHGGSYAGRFFASDNSGVTISQNVGNLIPGVAYSFSAWTNIPATADAFTLRYELRWLNAGGGTISTSAIATLSAATAGWVQSTQSLTAPASAASAQVRMIVSSLNATLYVDDVSFGNTPPPADTTAPVLAGRTPASGATGVAAGASVSVTFTEAVAGVSGTTFTLSGPAGLVAATVSYNSANNTATLTPAGALTQGATYTANLAAGIADLAGNPLAPLSWSFTIADTTAPTVTERTPAPGAIGISTATNVVVVFSEALNAGTINASSVTLSGPGGPVAATVSYNPATRMVTLQPAAALAPGAAYVVTLSSAITDLAGNPLAPLSWSFGTSSAPAPPPHTIFLPLAAE
ncbi:MAG: Ig-like domain-containing protein [Kouleothrix sp.]|jgi:hypothetical protein|nr:Ig-like domain-containing protein [Kouleothrix sp.]